MKIQYESNFSFIIINSSQKRCLVLCVCFTRLCKGCSTTELKQLVTPVIETFQLTLENRGCYEFQFHVAKLS